MTDLLNEFGLLVVISAFVVTGFGGFVKGAVGFALPMIMISGIGSLMSAEVAIAALIIPALVTNLWQASREGVGAAVLTIREYWRLNVVLLITIAVCAQLVAILPEDVLFIILGGMVTVFGVIQLAGWRPGFPARLTNVVEYLTGLVAGFFGGLSGVWGPPILLYLLARDTPKKELVRAQGVSFLGGSVVLVGAHAQSGVLNDNTFWLSVCLVVPALAGMVAGRFLQDRLDQNRFRRLTLIVLVIAGVNLLRRGLIG